MDGKENETESSLIGEDQKKKPSSYDLHSNDNPGSVITQLRGENYDEWARAIKISLRARRKWGFIDGTIKKPEEGSSIMEDWWTVQAMLVSWILNTVEPTLRTTISYLETAKELWDDIKERFSVVNGPRIQQLKSDLAPCKQGGLSMVAYYGKLKALWDDLANYEQALACTCKGCTCGIQAKFEKRKEEERSHTFLMGLNDELYGTVSSNLLATDPMPSLNKMYSILVQEERMRIVTRGNDERTEVALAVRANARMKGREMKNKSVCAHCNKAGHDEAGCFLLIGYPEWWGERPRDDDKAGGRGRGQNSTGGTRSNSERCTKRSSARSCSSELGIQRWWRFRNFQHDRIKQGAVANFGRHSQQLEGDSK